MKKIALALLAASSYADTAHVDHHHGFAVELAAGGTGMGRSPSIDAETIDFKAGMQEIENLKLAYIGTSADLTNAMFLQTQAPIGYNANWNQARSSGNQLGFAGHLNMHYMMKKESLGVGLYVGMGYNGARSSSTMDTQFNNQVIDQVVNIYLTTNDSSVALYAPPRSSFEDLRPEATAKIYAQSTGIKPEDKMDGYPQGPSIPSGKATISSGLMFNAGTRLGAFMGSWYPHVRVGWAAYQLRAQMTNQRAPFSNETNLDIKDGPGSKADGLKIANGWVQSFSGDTYTFGLTGGTENTVLGDINPLYAVGDPINVSAKEPRWAHAVTVGAGLDWCMNNKIVLGMYYQAAICQKVTFDQWKQDTTQGITSSVVNARSEDVNSIPVETDTPTTAKITNTYGASTPTVSIRPIIQTVMFSAKYILNKA